MSEKSIISSHVSFRKNGKHVNRLGFSDGTFKTVPFKEFDETIQHPKKPRILTVHYISNGKSHTKTFKIKKNPPKKDGGIKIRPDGDIVAEISYNPDSKQPKI